MTVNNVLLVYANLKHTLYSRWLGMRSHFSDNLWQATLCTTIYCDNYFLLSYPDKLTHLMHLYVTGVTKVNKNVRSQQQICFTFNNRHVEMCVMWECSWYKIRWPFRILRIHKQEIIHFRLRSFHFSRPPLICYHLLMLANVCVQMNIYL